MFLVITSLNKDLYFECYSTPKIYCWHPCFYFYPLLQYIFTWLPKIEFNKNKIIGLLLLTCSTHIEIIIIILRFCSIFFKICCKKWTKHIQSINAQFCKATILYIIIILRMSVIIWWINLSFSLLLLIIFMKILNNGRKKTMIW